MQALKPIQPSSGSARGEGDVELLVLADAATPNAVAAALRGLRLTARSVPPAALAAELALYASRPAVVVVADDTAGRDALEAGAAGVVVASELDGALAPTVRAVAAGQLVVPPALRGRLERPVFTSREKQVLSMIVLGCTNRDIARRLHIAETTVKSHVKSSFQKLGVHSRSHACARILDPSEGLGLGILGLTPAANGGVRRPRVMAR
jgi:DNA-binding NarL/FixJ family response regulator